MARTLALSLLLSAPADAATVQPDEHGLAWYPGYGYRHESECRQLPMWQSRTLEWPRYECESVPLEGLKAVLFVSAPRDTEFATREAPSYAPRPSNQHTRTPPTWTPPPLPPLFAPTPRTPHMPTTPPPPVVPLPASFWMLLAALGALPLWRKPT